jgi:hypothetical protein
MRGLCQVHQPEGHTEMQNVYNLLYRCAANIIIVVIYVFTPLSNNCEGGGGGNYIFWCEM